MLNLKTALHERICPICSFPEKSHLYTQMFGNEVLSLSESYDVVVCNHCGFVYAEGIPSQADFNNYYAQMSKYEFNYSDGIVSDEYVVMFTKIVNFLIPHLNDKNARILDIGCSTGCLLSLFKLNGYLNLLGLDPSSSCVKTIKELYNIEATVNSIYSFDTDEKFDLIILSSVLEHLVDCNNSMQKIYSLLKDHGLLFIEVPDAERFDLYISAPFQQFSIEHINYFSQYSIKNLLSIFHFKILKMQQNECKLNRTIHPDIHMLSQKTDENNFTMIRDNISELKIRDYITKCSIIDLEVKSIIKNKLLNKNKIIVWGVGTHTQRLIASGLDLSKVLYFVDSNTRYAGKKVKGIEIKLPCDIKDESPILISTYSCQDEIVHQIKEFLKLNNEIITIYSEGMF
ncbi:MAG: class I SAM-dependent methyltransferase [Nitrospirae bacterium]|nr:class I SAM-dependent methyltransferase [Nitrospirota bacterium]MBF0533467.1 class I SAM-dependent methyltransferase [Nitrospirota bacterium]MBF0616009.1 class I SAM-dependent methyltransferase [Nitrospirota bacterium]